jgi:hypothetical protein
MRIGKKLIILQIASVCLACAVFFGLCLKREKDPPFISEPKAIWLGESMNCQAYLPVELTVKEIDAAKGNCLIVVRSLDGHQMRQGMVNAGEPISFAQDLFGGTSVYIEHIEKQKAYVVFQFGQGSYKYRIHFPWEKI